jgi:radical SAM protein with 4Fe4S-binding SPASM domain
MWERDGFLAISPDGRLYSCVGAVGIKEFELGDVAETPLEDLVFRKAQVVAKSPTLDAECETCSYLSMCRSGCPYERLERFGSFDKKFCNRSLFDGYLGAMAEALAEREKEEGGTAQ